MFQLAAAPILLRHWKIAAMALFLATAVYNHLGILRAERALERCRGEAALAGLRLEQASQAARALGRDSERRAAAQARQLGEARRDNEGQRPLIEQLQRSASAPPTGADCAPSDSLRKAEGQL